MNNADDYYLHTYLIYIPKDKYNVHTCSSSFIELTIDLRYIDNLDN